MADIVHLIISVGASLDWQRILRKTGEHWPLLLAQLQMFNYVYPESRGRVPDWLVEELLVRARHELRRPRTDEQVTRGTLVSRFSFAIDVNEWGFRDLRQLSVDAVERLPVVQAIAASPVWDEVSGATEEYHARFA
jgi:hypothetical protein